MIRNLCALVALLFALSAGAQNLRWTAPDMVDPVRVELGVGYSWTERPVDRDCIVKLPADKKVGLTAIVACYAVLIIGGYLTIPVGDTRRHALYIKGATGTAHIESALIDSAPLTCT